VKEIQSKVQDFLKQNGMDPDDISMDQVVQVFLDEMEKGLAGQQSSLAMLPTYIDTEAEIPRGESVIVMDAGGTNFRVAAVCFENDGTATISDYELFDMPGLKEQVSKEEFFKIMAGYIEHVADKSTNVGFCFSYPIEMFPSKDGRVLYFSKEIKAPEVEGQMIGENLNLAISSALGTEKKQMVLLNDTVATLLAGRAALGAGRFESYIGLILGTGTNCSYVEQNGNITKAKGLDTAKSQIINVESGGFGKAPRGNIDKEFNEASLNPGVNVFEKMISGAYLGPVCLWALRAAVDAKFFSDPLATGLKQLKELSTEDLSKYLYDPAGDNALAGAAKGADENDCAALYYLSDRVVERAAKLTAINLSSVALKSGKGRNPCRPVCIVAEGTTFYKLTSLRQRIEYYLKQYLVEQKNVFYQITAVENATLIGAAIAGLTN
jgi:hexokinase